MSRETSFEVHIKMQCIVASATFEESERASGITENMFVIVHQCNVNCTICLIKCFECYVVECRL